LFWFEDGIRAVSSPVRYNPVLDFWQWAEFFCVFGGGEWIPAFFVVGHPVWESSARERCASQFIGFFGVFPNWVLLHKKPMPVTVHGSRV
jgi:hypothetical protein